MSVFANCPRCRRTFRVHNFTARNQLYCPSCEQDLEREADATEGRPQRPRERFHIGPDDSGEIDALFRPTRTSDD